MAFIINKRGERVQVDMEVDWYSQNCVLYADDAGLKPCYILNLYKHHDGSEIELVKQVVFRDNPPDQDHIMVEMWKSGLSRFDLVTIETGYELDWSDTGN